MGSPFFMNRNLIVPYANEPKLTRCHIIVHVSIHVVAMWAATSDATLAATSDAMSMSMSLMVEHVALFVTTSVTFIFVIDIGFELG